MKVKRIDLTPKRLFVVIGTLLVLAVLLIIIFNLAAKNKTKDSFLISNGDLYLVKGNKNCAKITSVLEGDPESPYALATLESRISCVDDYVVFSDNADPSATAVTYYVTDRKFKEPAQKIGTRISKILLTKNNIVFLSDGVLSTRSFDGNIEKTDISVADFVISPNGNVISYVKTGGELYVKNGDKEPAQLDINITELGAVTEKGIVYYTKNEVLYAANQVKNKDPKINKICSELPEKSFIFGDFTTDKFYFLTYSKEATAGGEKISIYNVCYFDGKNSNELQKRVAVSTIKLAPDGKSIAFISQTDSESKLYLFRGGKLKSKSITATDIISFSDDSSVVFAKNGNEIIKSRC